MDELLAELGITPIGQDTDHRNSEPFSVLYDDPPSSLEDSSGSILELRNAPPTPLDLNVLVDNIWSSEIVNKDHLSGQNSPNPNRGVINKITTYKSSSPTSMADLENANISIENYSYNCPSVTSSETDYSSVDSMEYEYVIQPNNEQEETTYQVSQTFSILHFIIFYIIFLIFVFLVYLLNVIFRQRIPQICQFAVKQRKPPHITKSIPQRR